MATARQWLIVKHSPSDGGFELEIVDKDRHENEPKDWAAINNEQAKQLAQAIERNEFWSLDTDCARLFFAMRQLGVLAGYVALSPSDCERLPRLLRCEYDNDIEFHCSVLLRAFGGKFEMRFGEESQVNRVSN